MPPRKLAVAPSVAINPDDLPNSGEEVAIETRQVNSARKLFQNPGAAAPPPRATRAEVQDAEWSIAKQDEDFQFPIFAVLRPKPSKATILEHYGPGKYKIAPNDDLTREPIESLAEIIVIARTPRAEEEQDQEGEYENYPPQPGDLPPMFARLMEKQDDARRRDMEAMRKQVDQSNQTVALLMGKLTELADTRKDEQLRFEREERIAREQRGDKKEESMATILIALLNKPQERNITPDPAVAQLTQSVALLAQRLELQSQMAMRQPSGPDPFAQAVSMLANIDGMAERKALRYIGAEQNDEEPDFQKELLEMGKNLLAGRAPGGDQQLTPEQLGRALQSAFARPDVLAQVLKQDPGGAARALKQVLDQSPEVGKALEAEFDKPQGGGA